MTNKKEEQQQQGFFCESYQIQYIKNRDSYYRDYKRYNQEVIKLPNIMAISRKQSRNKKKLEVKYIEPPQQQALSFHSKELPQDSLRVTQHKKNIFKNSISAHKIKKQNIQSPLKQRKIVLFNNNPYPNLREKLIKRGERRYRTEHTQVNVQDTARYRLQRQVSSTDDGQFVAKMRHLFKQLKSSQREVEPDRREVKSVDSKKADSIHSEKLSCHLMNLSKQDKILRLKRKSNTLKSIEYHLNDAGPLLKIKSQVHMEHHSERSSNNCSHLKSLIKRLKQQKAVGQHTSERSLQEQIPVMLQKIVKLQSSA